MRVLVACEVSGIVREAFRARGHIAVSCDLLPSDRPGPHITGDVFDVLTATDRGMWEPWDMMIFFWPCTNLAVSGARYFAQKREAQARDVEAFTRLATWPTIPRIAGENPIGVLSTRFRKPDQIIQPWYFGDDASKATCLWLKGLPLLRETNRLPGDNRTRRANQTPSGQNKLGPSPDRAKRRAETYPGIAAAMADQWGAL